MLCYPKHTVAWVKFSIFPIIQFGLQRFFLNE